MTTLDPDVLGRILILNNLLHAATNEVWLGEVAAGAFATIPGVASVGVYLDDALVADSPLHPSGTPPWPASRMDLADPIKTLSIRTPLKGYGHIALSAHVGEALHPYLPFVENTANTLALVIENLRQKHALETMTRELEQEVARKVAEMRAMDSHYRVLAESTRAIPWELDLATMKFVYVGPQFSKLLGFPAERLADFTSWREMVHPDDRDNAVSYCNEMTRQGLDHDFVYRTLRSDGTICWLHDIVTVVMGEHGPEKLLGYMIDVTGQKQAEEKLREINLRHNEAVKAANVGLWDWDLRTNAVSFSAEWKSQLGYGEEELADSFETWRSRLHPDDLERTLQAVQQCLGEEARDYQAEFRFLHRDNSYRWILAQGSLIRAWDGSPMRLLGSHVDITALKEAEETIRRHEEELLASQKVAGLGTYRWSIASDGFKGSDVLLDIFGIDAAYPRTLAGWAALVHPDDREMMKNYVTGEVLGRRQPFDKEYRIVRPADGEERWVHGRGELLHDATGEPVELFGTIQDITVRKEEYRQSLRAAQLAAIGELAAGVAHEINNPITGIINCAQLLISRQAIEEKNLEVAERIVREGNRIAVIVRNLLLFARDSGSQRDEVCLQELVEQVASLCHGQLDKSGITLEVALPEAPVLVKANAQQLEQVFVNLISNARHALFEKYQDGSGAPRIEITVDPHADDDGFCRVTVLDNGSGIPDSLMAKIGKPFVTTKPAGVGTGLGLSISQEIVKRHGGDWRIESAEGEFTRVTFSLPLVNPSQTGSLSGGG